MPTATTHAGCHRLLMVGTDAVALRGLRRRPDIEVVSVYGPDRKASGRQPVGDNVIPVFAEDAEDVESILSALARAGQPLDGFDGVYTKEEQSVVLACVLGKLAGIRTVAPDVALRFRDKSLQKRCLRQAGLPTADFEVVDDILDLDPQSVARLLPAVAKPIAGAGTQETALVTDTSELAAVVDRARERGGLPRTYLLEGFVPGQEWICNGIVFDGEVLFMTLGRYADPCLTAISQARPLHMYTYGLGHLPEAYEQAAPLVQQALSVLGLDFGVFHMELFRRPQDGGFVFSECAARRGGGLVQQQTAHQFGVDLAVASIDCAVGLKPDFSAVRERCAVTGSAFLPVKGGYLVSCPDAVELTARPHVEYACIDLPLGTPLPECPSNLVAHKIGQIMVTGPDQPTVAGRLEECTAWFRDRIRTIPANANGRVLREYTRATGFSLESGVDLADE